MRANLSIDLAHRHFTVSDWFGLSIPTGMFKISIPVIDNFDTYVLFLSHLQCKKDVDEVEQAQCRISAMVGAGLLALQGEAGRTCWFSLEKEWFWGDPVAASSTHENKIKEMEPGSSW